ncbi:polymer-forming cytoskeletal protein [Natrinema sp. H-ect1]|uniref:polymer-forming cytoskeletal protein n=1 Tax=Natrinema sp. H-ect1 TaxID=3242700 RepID=UPI00359CEBB4
MNGVHRLALVCLLVGGVLLAGPAFGFATVSSERGVTAMVAGDQQNAYLGIEDNTATENQIRPNSQVEVLRLHDNGVGIDSTADIEAEIVEFAGEQDDGFDVSVEEENGKYPIVVECAGSDGGTGTMVFDLEATGTATVDTTWKTENEVDVNCGGNGGGGPGGSPGLSVTSVAPPNGGVVTFELENTGTDFRLRSVAVDHAKSTAIDGEMTITTAGETRTISDNPEWRTDGSRVDIGGKFEILSGDTATVEIDRFDADMNAESFTVTFVDDRGSSETTETVTVDVPCNAETNDCSGTDADAVVSDSGYASDDVSSGGSVSAGDGSYIDGNVDAGDDVTAGNESTIEGDVSAGGDIAAGDDSYVNGDLDAGDDVTTGDGNTIAGNVNADGETALGNESYVDGDIDAGDDVTTGDESTIAGDVTTDGDAVFGTDGYVDGNVNGDDIVIGEDTTIAGNIDGTGSVTTVAGSYIDGDVTATETVTIAAGAEVHGDIQTDGDVIIGENAYVDGNIDAGGEITINDGAQVMGDVTTSQTLVLDGEPYIGGDRSYESCDGCT